MLPTDLYCSRADVNHRLALGSITSPTGIVASSPAATNVITFDGHGLETDDKVTVRALEGGNLSAPLVEGTVYYARRLTNATFELAATAGGEVLDLTSDAVSMVVTREPAYDEIIEQWSRWADTSLPGHLVPLQPPIHPLVKGIVASLAAHNLLTIGGQDSAIQDKVELASKAQLERLSKGLPLRGASATPSANMAITLAAGTVDPRGWGSGLLP